MHAKGKLLLEKYFKVNGSSETKPIALEKSFNIKIGGIKFYGKIDRIDPLEDGGVEIIDYKTGQTKDQKTIDNDDQLTYYAIAAKEALGLVPKKLTYYFVEENKKITTSRSEEQLLDIKEKAKSTVADIVSGKFVPKPSMLCKFCDYNEICPHAYKG